MAIFAKLPELFVPVFMLIWQTAARRGEILDLKHDQVDREKRQITLKKTKSGKTRIVPISDLALEALDAIPPCQDVRMSFTIPKPGLVGVTVENHGRMPAKQQDTLGSLSGTSDLRWQPN